MTEPIETRLGQAIRSGDQAAFEQAYDRYRQRVRVIAWRISHRADWVDDLLNEAWCRAFSQRQSYNPEVPFPVWLAGILQNVYREQCRRSLAAARAQADREARRAVQSGADASPAEIAGEAELLEGLNDCVGRLSVEDARIVELRFFKGMPLRSVAKEVGIPESTLREARLPAAFEALRRCLERKGIRTSQLFSAQRGDESE
jgi:RNA polymerase sigma factor (sigma-70 family)